MASSWVHVASYHKILCHQSYWSHYHLYTVNMLPEEPIEGVGCMQLAAMLLTAEMT